MNFGRTGPRGDLCTPDPIGHMSALMTLVDPEETSTNSLETATWGGGADVELQRGPMLFFGLQ